MFSWRVKRGLETLLSKKLVNITAGSEFVFKERGINSFIK